MVKEICFLPGMADSHRSRIIPDGWVFKPKVRRGSDASVNLYPNSMHFNLFVLNDTLLTMDIPDRPPCSFINIFCLHELACKGPSLINILLVNGVFGQIHCFVAWPPQKKKKIYCFVEHVYAFQLCLSLLFHVMHSVWFSDYWNLNLCNLWRIISVSLDLCELILS